MRNKFVGLITVAVFLAILYYSGLWFWRALVWLYGISRYMSDADRIILCIVSAVALHAIFSRPRRSREDKVVPIPHAPDSPAFPDNDMEDPLPEPSPTKHDQLIGVAKKDLAAGDTVHLEVLPDGKIYSDEVEVSPDFTVADLLRLKKEKK